MTHKELIANVLKEYRRRNKMTVKDVVTHLEKNSIQVAEKTIYGWENAQSLPDIDTLMILCTLYNISDILSTFGYKKEKPFDITKQEQLLITKFREHPEFHGSIFKLLEIKPISKNYYE